MHEFCTVNQCIIILLTLLASCSPSNQTPQQSSSEEFEELSMINNDQLGEYLVEIFEDSKGNIWFGTLKYGVAKYDGKQLVYLTTEDGLPGNTVTAVAEDVNGHLWFGTRNGVSKYDGTTFTNYGWNEGLYHGKISNLMFDNTGKLWIGAWGGVCTYDGTAFSRFELPKPAVKTPYYQETANWVTDIIQDRNGDMWFSRSGLGLCKYDGTAFTHYTKADGLPSNCVQEILEDSTGNLWIGTRVAERDNSNPTQRDGEGGLCLFDGKTFKHFPAVNGLSQNDVYALYRDTKNRIWIGATGLGLYCYNGTSFKLFEGTDRMDLTYSIGIQGILEDRNGVMWLGYSGGLFRLENGKVTNVTKRDLNVE